MAIVSSTDGSPTKTGWKRRSSAASFSMCLRYSSSVVAPTTCSSPRANAGFSMLEASIAPSAAPAPTSVCNSSMKTTYFPSALVISLSTALSRSSNSPRYLVPAINARGGEELLRGGPLLFYQGEEQMLGRHVRVTQRLGFLVGAVQDA